MLRDNPQAMTFYLFDFKGVLLTLQNSVSRDLITLFKNPYLKKVYSQLSSVPYLVFVGRNLGKLSFKNPFLILQPGLTGLTYDM